MTGGAAPAREDADGNPFWTFRVKHIHLQGNGRIAFPQEVAIALGCRPDALTRVTIENPGACRKLMVCWEQKEPARTVILHLSEPLKRIGAAHEQLVDLVVAGPNRVTLRPSLSSKCSEPSTELQNPNPPKQDSLQSAQPNPPAPWGTPPTPLLPRWYLESLAAVRLPPKLRAWHNGGVAGPEFVADLAASWESQSGPVRNMVLRALRNLVSQHEVPPKDQIVVASETSLVRLLECPLSERPRNCIVRVLRSSELDPDRPVTVGQLLALKNFGITSLLEVMCVAEAAIESGFLAAASVPGLVQPATAPMSAEPPDDDALEWEAAIPSLQLLLSAAVEFYGARTLGEALACDLGKLITELRLESRFNEILTSDLTRARSVEEEVLAGLGELWESMTPLEQLVLTDRMLASDPPSLQEIGSRVSLSRERIRQIQRSLESRLSQLRDVEGGDPYWMGLMAATIRHQIGPVVAENELEKRVLGAFSDAGAPEEQGPIVPVARQLLRKELGYTCDDGICLDGAASEVVQGLKQSAQRVADDSGLIDDQDLRDCLPKSTWQQHWPVLLALCGLLRLSGRLALRDTARARARAALISIGRPATKEEIAEQCGLDPGRAGAQLSAMDGVVRADKSRWGLAEWIDDVYEGIPAEIVQRINEDGGATPLDRLVDELPRLFGVSESSVRTYVGTPQFVLRDGYVSLADESSIALRYLNDVIDGRDDNGNPYWTFAAENRYFAGYSLAGFPPELASALGCPPNGKTQALVDYPAGCRDLSVIWRLASPTGASLGYLAEPLNRLGVSGGDRVRVVIKDPGVVELRRDSTTDVPGSNATTPAESLLERMKNRRMVV